MEKKIFQDVFLFIILDRVFNKVGFNQIEDEIFRKLVQSRLSYPSSKSATVEYLKNHFDEDVNLTKIYRYLEKLNHSQQDKIQDISVVHTQQLLGGLVFRTVLLTNTDLAVEQIYTAYHNLWNMERAFRIAKSKIEIRPIFHFTRKRIEAHICICFVALKVYKELSNKPISI